ncbi:MAG TPA: bacitracin ABC transporter ATP-binding protein [Bacteroidetes bacterium]|nr:bacitracin ABC transporter ATP-binding protein [Bacteroidota bacterium]
MSDIILRTTNLGKRYKNRWAAQDINLEVHRGDVFGFLGPNGAGKSTSIRMILSLIKPTTGKVELFGHDLFQKRELALQDVAGIVEKPDFYLYLSAYRNMQIAGSLTLGKTPADKKIMETLDIVGLTDRALDKVKTFSHGMKQRLGIAQALLCDPQLIMLDEPTNGLDPQGMKEVRELIVRLTTERGITVFLSSHLLNEVEQVATRMAIINKGKMLVQGSVEELLKANADKVLFNVEPIKKTLVVLRAIKSVSEISQTEEGIVAKVNPKNIPSVINELVKAKCKVFSVQPKHSLEEYFLEVTNES